MVSDKHIKLPTCPKIPEKQLSLKVGDVYRDPSLTLPIKGKLYIIKVIQVLQEFWYFDGIFDILKK